MLLASEKADAAQEVAQLAAGDNRLAIIATLFLPVRSMPRCIFAAFCCTHIPYVFSSCWTFHLDCIKLRLCWSKQILINIYFYNLTV